MENIEAKIKRLDAAYPFKEGAEDTDVIREWFGHFNRPETEDLGPDHGLINVSPTLMWKIFKDWLAAFRDKIRAAVCPKWCNAHELVKELGIVVVVGGVAETLKGVSQIPLDPVITAFIIVTRFECRDLCHGFESILESGSGLGGGMS